MALTFESLGRAPADQESVKPISYYEHHIAERLKARAEFWDSLTDDQKYVATSSHTRAECRIAVSDEELALAAAWRTLNYLPSHEEFALATSAS